MQDSKLIQLIQSFTKEEIRVFGNYLEGTSYRKTSNVFALFNYLKKLHPVFPEEKIAKEYVFKKIMPKGKVYNNKRMRDVMSILSITIENFLLAKELEESEMERELLMLNVLRKRKQDKLFFQKVHQIQKKWEKDAPPGIERYLYEYLIQKAHYSHPNYVSVSEKKMSLHNLMEKIDNYYLASKLYCTVNLLQTQNHLKPKDGNQPILFIEDINKICNDNPFNKNPHINILNLFFHAYIQKDYSNYDYLKKLYVNNINAFNDSEKFDLLLILQHYCYINYQQGNEQSLKEVFNLYKFSIEQKIVIEDEMLAHDMFRSIVAIGCKVGEIAWTEQFIMNYQQYLPINNRSDIVLLCEAIVIFCQQDFETCLSKLLTVKFQDTVYGIQVRALLMKCYYELNNYEEAFHNIAHSFSIFLHRNNAISDKLKELNLNFIQFLKKLHKEKYEPSKKQENLVAVLEKYKIIRHKEWLIKKAIELQ